MEYYVQPNTFSNSASDITQHVPKYLSNNIFKIIGNSVFDIILSLNKTNQSEISVYKFMWNGEEKIQSSWSKWIFNENILGGEIINNTLYLVVSKGNETLLTYIDLQENYVTEEFETPIPILIDNLFIYNDGSATNDGTYTYIPVPYYNSTFEVINDLGQNIEVLDITDEEYGSTIKVLGDKVYDTLYIGNKYNMLYRFSQFILRDQQGLSVAEYKLKLKNMIINYADTGYFDIEVTPSKRDTYNYKFTGNTLGVSFLLGNINIDTGKFNVPLMCGNEGLTIDIKNDTFLPCKIQSVEWNTKSSSKFRR
jgi:hypothetical protein